MSTYDFDVVTGKPPAKGGHRLGHPAPKKPPKLKPCPFCGSPAKIVRSDGWHEHAPASVSIRCSNDKCGRASTRGRETNEWKLGKGTYSVFKQALKDVIAQWEERVNPDV